LHRRKRCRGKQHETKICHDGPRKISGNNAVLVRKTQSVTAINKQALGRNVAPSKADLVFIYEQVRALLPLFIAHSGDHFKPKFYIVPCGILGTPGFRFGSERGKSAIPVSVAGEGPRGPSGPRTGSSSGVRPGNSSGRGGSPGSCIGGGTSGRGLPGGLSWGGSDGCPGLIGGSCCGSIGTTARPCGCRRDRGAGR
jgi:hypothetical protein